VAILPCGQQSRVQEDTIRGYAQGHRQQAGEGQEEVSDPGDERPVLNYADPDVDRWVLIAFFPRSYLGRLASFALDAEGISSRFGKVAPEPLQKGCELLVRADDYPKAVEVLSRTPAKSLVVKKQS
jgi:hypothetical protein